VELNLPHLIIDPLLVFPKNFEKLYSKIYLIIRKIMLYWTSFNMIFEAKLQRRILFILC